MEKHIINKSNFDRHLDLLNSPDKDNLTVLIGILKECDLVKSAPWITLLLIHIDNYSIKKEIFSEIPILSDKGSYYAVSTNQAYELLYRHKDEDAINYLIKRFEKLVTKMYISSGSTFLEEDYELKIVKRNESKSIK